MFILGSLNRQQSGVAFLLTAFPEGNRTDHQSPPSRSDRPKRVPAQWYFAQNIRPGVVVEVGNLRICIARTGKSIIKFDPAIICVTAGLGEFHAERIIRIISVVAGNVICRGKTGTGTDIRCLSHIVVKGQFKAR